MTERGEGSELCWPLQTSGNKISLWYRLPRRHIFMSHIYLALLAVCASLSCKAIPPPFPETTKGPDSDIAAHAGQQLQVPGDIQAIVLFGISEGQPYLHVGFLQVQAERLCMLSVGLSPTFFSSLGHDLLRHQTAEILSHNQCRP